MSTTFLPFAIDRGAALDLTEQITQGIDGAISAGRFSPGERLPGIREIARELGVSNVVVCRAVRHLQSAGRLSARRRSGIRVATAERPVWRGHALLVDTPAPSYYFAARAKALVESLQAENLRVSTLACDPADGDRMLERVNSALDSMGVSLVILASHLPELQSACVVRGLPVVMVAASEAELHGVRAGVVYRTDRALADLALHIRDLNVPRILSISLHQASADAFAAALAPLGLRADWEPLGRWDRHEGAEGYEYAGFQTTRRLLAEDRLPDLIYAADDHIARGCLTALLLAGKCPPRDVQLVTWLNRGDHPAWTGPFTCIESDPVAHGCAIAQAALAALQDDAGPIAYTIVEPRFIAGATTCPLLARPPF